MNLSQYAALAAAAALGASGLAAHAQGAGVDWPSRTVRFIVPYAPGGPTDIVGRLAAARLAEKWGHPVLVENRPGANANVGAELAARSAPDGYTLFLCTGSTHGINAAIYPKLNYDPLRDFIPVVTLTESTLYLAVPPQMPVATVPELVEYARARPGKLNYGSPGLGSAHHLSGELLKVRTGIDIVHVPFKGSAPALAALQAGEIQILFDSAALPHAKSGKIRILAVASRSRWPASPEIPTVIEQGIADFEARGWFGICVPAGTPMAIVERINRDANEVLREPETRKRLTDVGLHVAGGAQADMAAAIRRELAYWAEVVKASGAKVE